MGGEQLVDEIETAYQTHNLRHIRGFFFLRGKRFDYACPIVALAVHRGVAKKDDEDADSVALKWAVATFGEAWVMGFLDGFDGHTRKIADPEYSSGHEAGERVLPRNAEEKTNL